jgi:hypothetical protein
VTSTDGETGTWTAAAGTGKYQGMVAKGSYGPLGLIPSSVPGKETRCNRNTGTYTLK